MDVPPVAGCPDTYLVDNELFGMSGALSTYLLDAERPVVLDAGTEDSAERILAAMDAVGIDPAAVASVVVTHVHLDHAAGTGQLLDACENATALVHERGLPYLTDRERLDRLLDSVEAAHGFPEPYGDPDPVPADRCRALSGGERLDLGDRVLDVVDAPGHAPHHYACFEPDSGMLFAADAVGAYDQGSETVAPSTPPPSFDLDANLATIERLRDRDPSRVLFSHFGPGSDDGTADLDAAATVLPEWVDAVRAARESVGEDGDVSEFVEELTPEWQSPTLQRDIVGVLQYLDRQ
jgi:glyoxylase-like metal-dependent hydrolase (beta-lactamase superfamily II)